MAQIDYEKIKQRNIEHSERPKMFSELKEGDEIHILDINTLGEIFGKVVSIEVKEDVETDYSFVKDEEKKYAYSTVKMMVERNDSGKKIDLPYCYGTHTFIMKDGSVYCSTDRERKAIKRILKEKCECQVSHLAMMFNGALVTKQYRDPNSIVLG